MAIIVQIIPKQQAVAYQKQIVAIYLEAFERAPYFKSKSEVAAFAQAFPRTIQQDSFKLVGAIVTGSKLMVGYAYGIKNDPAQGWFKIVAEAAPYLVDTWLKPSFRFAEMAVLPAKQGIGIGGRLHDQLLSKLPYKKAVLSTMSTDTNAWQLYKKRGWQVLLDNLYVPNLPRTYRIMGLDLR